MIFWEQLGRYSDSVTGLTAEELGFDSGQGQEIVLFSTTFRPALGLTQSPLQWVEGAASPGIKRTGCEADHSLPSCAKVKNGRAIPPVPNPS
jgi:hypothetical protein